MSRAMRALLGTAAAAWACTGAALADEGPGCVALPWAEGGAFRGNLPSPPRAATGPPALAPAPSTGTVNLLVILAEFSDLPHRAPPSRFQDLLFGPLPSLADYYNEVSGGALDVTGEIHGWVTLPNSQFYYSQGQAGVANSYPNNGQGMAEDAVQAALAADLTLALRLNSFDADGDGFVDAVLVIHSGQGWEWAGTPGAGSPSPSPDPDAINSHKWAVQQPNFGGTAQIGDYFTCPELQLAKATVAPGWTDSVSTIGVYCHEFGHVVGLPDYYDTQTLENHVGLWGIMDYGTWSRIVGNPSLSAPGALPSHLAAWSKVQVGWTVPQVAEAPVGDIYLETLTLTSASLGGGALQALRNPGGPDWTQAEAGVGEYFLAEVRTQDGYDAGLPAEGLLLYHVDEGRPSNNADLNADGGALHGLIPQDATITIGTSTSRNDPWPGSQSTFGESSNPASGLWNGSPSGVTFSGIGPVSAGAVTFTVEVATVASEVALPFARPNPFRPQMHGSTTLVLSLGQPSSGKVVIVDILGRRVRELPAGSTVVWDGRREDGRPALAGVYAFRHERAPSETGRIVVLR